MIDDTTQRRKPGIEYHVVGPGPAGKTLAPYGTTWDEDTFWQALGFLRTLAHDKDGALIGMLECGCTAHADLVKVTHPITGTAQRNFVGWVRLAACDAHDEAKGTGQYVFIKGGRVDPRQPLWTKRGTTALQMKLAASSAYGRTR